jgi:ATP-dependent DNA helicase RecG
MAMLSTEQLSALLGDLESDRVERTVSTNKTDKFAEAVCSFANDLADHRAPGYLIIGANDKDGSVAGIEITDQLLQNLAALRSDGNIQPLPSLTVHKYSLAGGDVAVVEVQPSNLPPVRYRGQVCIRVGPRRGFANEQDERKLTEKRIAVARTFDAQPVADATIDELSLTLFASYRAGAIAADVIEANHRTPQQQLASLRFFDDHRGWATAAGVLLFGKNPRYFLPGAYIQFLQLPGTGLTDAPVNQQEISGDLLSVLRELDSRVKAGMITTLAKVSTLREEVVPNYPEVAIREVLMNAVMHRDYQSNTPIRFYWFDDRIEIQSPGGLFGEVTRETLDRRNSYRNPVLAEAMKALGYVNRFGYGILRAEDAMKRNGNPPLEFQIEDNIVLAVIRRRPA